MDGLSGLSLRAAEVEPDEGDSLGEGLVEGVLDFEVFDQGGERRGPEVEVSQFEGWPIGTPFWSMILRGPEGETTSSSRE